MPVYCFVCDECGERDEIIASSPTSPPKCPACKFAMRRDYQTEAVGNNFKPSRDLYAQKKLRGK